VVDRKLGRWHRLVAVLTGAVIPKQKVAPVGPKHPSRDLDVGEQPDHHDIVSEATTRHGLFDGLARFIVKECDALLG
jgi:hypothetical protein